jgi:hypothetical protein
MGQKAGRESRRKPGPKPQYGDKAQTSPERQKRYREKLKADREAAIPPAIDGPALERLYRKLGLPVPPSDRLEFIAKRMSQAVNDFRSPPPMLPDPRLGPKPIAARTGQCARSVQRHIGDLVQGGLIALFIKTVPDILLA